VQIAGGRALLGLAGSPWNWAAFVRPGGRICSRIPPERMDDRALVTGRLAAILGFLVAGLFECSFGKSYVITLGRHARVVRGSLADRGYRLGAD
jgi:hypothetical protein